MTEQTDRPGRRPNVLFLITDQQRADHVGFAGNGVVRTPHLDGLAARGMVFDNAWVANPICMPNRSTIMTGRMPSAHGVVFNDRSLEWGANTHVRQFRDAGYRTGLFGKSHLQHGMSRESMVEIQSASAIDDPYETGWDTLEDFERYDRGVPELPGSFYGFDHVELAIDHGSRLTGHHLHWALDQGGRYEDLMVPMSDESPGVDRHANWWQIYRPPYNPDLHSTSFVADRTIAFIEDAAEADEPWLAWASFPDPHHPMCPPGDWFDRHDPADMELPSTVDDPLTDAPEYLKRLSRIHPSKQRFWVMPCGVAGDHDLVRAAIAATYGMIEMIDDRIGRILDAMDRLDQTRDTIVVFTTDHGDMMGDHGLMLKGRMHYKGTLQVPMIIADPRRRAGRTSSLAGSLDLGQTLLELGGLDRFDGMQGTSLVPILDDRSATVRDHVLIEDDLPHATAAIRSSIAKTRTLVTETHKYTRHDNGEDQLYDLFADPEELVHLGAADPVRRAEMIERLTDAVIGAADDARGTPVAAA
ncbi:MAG: sulfatase family protein [Acidimicrobiales bacterium]